MSLECLSFAQSIWEEMPRGRVIFVVVERFRLTSSPMYKNPHVGRMYIGHLSLTMDTVGTVG